jgi:hypothetical protein
LGYKENKIGNQAKLLKLQTNKLKGKQIKANKVLEQSLQVEHNLK